MSKKSMITFIFTSVGYWEEFGKPLIDSLIKYGDCEIIAVDQGNHFPEEYKSAIILKCEQVSRANAINQGLGRAKGDWLVILDDDMLAFGDYSIIKDFDIKKISGMKLFEYNARIDIMPSSWLNGFFIAIPRWVYEAVGEFDENFQPSGSFMDADYCIRAAGLGIGSVEVIVPFKHLCAGTKITINPHHPQTRVDNLAYLKKKHNMQKISFKYWQSKLLNNKSTISLFAVKGKAIVVTGLVELREGADEFISKNSNLVSLIRLSSEVLDETYDTDN